MSLHEMLEIIKQQGVVIFVGAGVSADAPASLPGWFSMNEMIIRALQHRVTKYLLRDSLWLEQIILEILQRRNQNLLPPEYQAQIMEEQAGINYFRAFTTLDADQNNHAHIAIAQLAKAGHVRAIITTNFDRLIEKTLEAENISCTTFIDLEGYQNLHTAPAQERLPIIKVHGSVEYAESIVDTLQQRLVGRSSAITNILAPLLEKHPVLYLGFSAADLNHDPNYLGLRASASSSPGAVFLHYPGSSSQPGADVLCAAYGSKVQVIEATLNDFFQNILPLLSLDIPAAPSVIDPDPKLTITKRLEAWASSLDPYEAINMLSALCDASGAEEAAWQILHKTWKLRIPSDTKGLHYAKYQYNYSSHCMQSGEMAYEELPQNFMRSENSIPQSNTGLALWGLYSAQRDLFSERITTAMSQAQNTGNIRLRGDLQIVLGQSAIIYHATSTFQPLLDEANTQWNHGEIYRALKLWSATARLASQTKEEANHVFGLFNHCEHWVNYLGDKNLSGELYLALGTAYLHANSAHNTLSSLEHSIPIFRQNQRWALLIEGLIIGVQACTLLNAQEEAAMLASEASQRIAKGYEIYFPHLGIAVAEYHLAVQQPDRALREIEACYPYAEKTKNIWALNMLNEQIAQIKNYQ